MHLNSRLRWRADPLGGTHPSVIVRPFTVIGDVEPFALGVRLIA